MASQGGTGSDDASPAGGEAPGPRGILRSPLDVTVCAALLLGTFLLYLPTLSNDFVAYDDNEYVTGNAVVQRGLSAETVRWAFTTTHFANWLPVTWLSHLLDVTLFGLDPAGHHATSNLLHALNAALLFPLLLRMTGWRWRSAAAAVLFAVHPLRVESVAWIAERKDVLAGTFFLLTLLAYVRYARRPSIGRYLLIPPLYALGLMSKTMLVTLPFLLLLLDVWPLNRLRPRRFTDPGYGATTHTPPRPLGSLLLEKLPLLVLSLVACAWTVVLQESGGALRGGQVWTLNQRLGNAAVSVSRYLGKIAWPTDLSVFYRHPGTWPAWQVAASAALIAALTAAAWVMRRRAPYLLVGWLWFLGMLFPVSGVIQAGIQGMADRYTYLPGIGLTVAAVWGVSDLLRRSGYGWRTAAAALALYASALSVTTWRQARQWQNTFTIFSQALAADERNWLAHSYVGSELAARGLRDEAIRHFRRAIELNPNFPDARYNLGNSLLREQALEEAELHYREAIRLEPAHAQAHHNLGVSLALRGRPEAADHFAEAVRLKPDWPDARVSLATVLAGLGKTAEATAHLDEALRLDPNHARARRLRERLVAGGTG